MRLLTVPFLWIVVHGFKTLENHWSRLIPMCPGACPGFNLLKGLRGHDDLHVLSLFASYWDTVLSAAL